MDHGIRKTHVVGWYILSPTDCHYSIISQLSSLSWLKHSMYFSACISSVLTDCTALLCKILKQIASHFLPVLPQIVFSLTLASQDFLWRCLCYQLDTVLLLLKAWFNHLLICTFSCSWVCTRSYKRPTLNNHFTIILLPSLWFYWD